MTKPFQCLGIDPPEVVKGYTQASSGVSRHGTPGTWPRTMVIIMCAEAVGPDLGGAADAVA
jgi:hypothetical protein